MITKICTKCKKELDISCFGKRKARKNKQNSWCKYCYKEYNSQHKEYHASWQKQYDKENKERLFSYYKQYQEDHIEERSVYSKRYRKENKKSISKQAKIYNKKPALFKTYAKRLEIFEEVRCCPGNLELLEVKCAYCGKWMLPTNNQVSSRLQAFDGTISGECRFYCSENCKTSCPIFNQKHWPKGFKKATSREVVPLLRQLVLKMDNYTCQMCGATTETAQLHVHHEKSYTLNKIMANDPDNCITLCKDCHKWVHSQEGCKYIDLTC